MKTTQARAAAFFDKAGIILTEQEKECIEIADFGLNALEQTGLQLVTYINTQRVCAKEMVLLPRQTCPEHLHPDVAGTLGKEETFRCRWGKVYLYVEGDATSPLRCTPPSGSYTVSHEVVLEPGQQYTIYPNTRHWFQGGEQGAVVSEFSTRSTDENDVFTDVRIIR